MKHVLLADDDSDDAEIFEESLHRTCPGDTFQRFENGKKLLDHLASHKAELPDIIFLDLNMPEMNGWQCLASLKTNSDYSDIPVVMYTTSSNPRDREIALDLNAHGLVVKPSTQRVLDKILGSVICKLGTKDLKQAVNDAYLLSKDW